MAKKKAKRVKSAPADPREALVGLVEASELLSIRLDRCMAERNDEPPAESEDPTKAILNITLGHQLQTRESGPSRLVYTLFVTTKAFPRAKPPSVSIVAVFVAVYLVRPGTPEPSQDLVEAFGQEVAIFSMWPYWRELAQSMTVRMHMPPLGVPLLRHDMLNAFEPTDSPFTAP